MRTICESEPWSAFSVSAYLDGAEDPENEGLHDGESGGADAEHEVDAEILANVGVAAGLGVFFGPILEPYATSWSRVSEPCDRNIRWQRDAVMLVKSGGEGTAGDICSSSDPVMHLKGV